MVVGGVQSHFRVQPDCSVEVALCCVGVVTIRKACFILNFLISDCMCDEYITQCHVVHGVPMFCNK